METNGDISLLPEDCVSKVVSLTGSPRDACRLSLVSPFFKSAAESDAVWDTFLPCDYQVLLSRSSSPTSICYRSKKELYLTLCDEPLLIDNGTKSFYLDKSTGKKCYMLSARDLSIAWGDTPRYWEWMSRTESRSLLYPKQYCDLFQHLTPVKVFDVIDGMFFLFTNVCLEGFHQVAKLRSVCWLDICGKIHTNMLSARTHYAAYFVFNKTRDADGFRDQPIETRVGLAGGVDDCKQTVYLTPQPEEEERQPYQAGTFDRLRSNVRRFLRRGERGGGSGNQQQYMYVKQRGDGWFEVELGNFFNCDGDDGEVQMSISEIKTGSWKTGLIVEGIEIRPKRAEAGEDA